MNHKRVCIFHREYTLRNVRRKFPRRLLEEFLELRETLKSYTKLLIFMMEMRNSVNFFKVCTSLGYKVSEM